MSEQAVIPAWVVADHRQVAEFNYMVFTLATELESVHAQGQLAAVGWITGVRAAPMTQRTQPVTWALGRAESWAALCFAAWNGTPAARDWQLLGVDSRPTVAGNADFAHGAWRTLAWLLGARPDPPIEVPVRDADGNLPPGEERFGYRGDPTSLAWQAADQRRRDRNRAEARRYWQHIRDRVDASEHCTGSPGLDG